MSDPRAWWQYLLPQHLLSRVAGTVAACTWGWVRKPLIRLFVSWFRVTMDEAAEPDAMAYASFNDFFTRPLAPTARPLSPDPGALLSPVDGVVSQLGRIEGERLLQAKGIRYSLGALLGDADAARAFEDGSFATLYLSPRDYHRVHAPLAGDLARATYVPGRLFSVDPVTAAAVPGLFARNERLVFHFATAHGPVAVVMVGALIVAAIQPAWRTEPYAPRTPIDEHFNPPLRVARAAEIGRFLLGSTVIIVAPRGVVNWLADLGPGSALRMGSRIGDLTPARG